MSNYIKMQRDFYNNEINVLEKVGNYDYHENFPYETLLLYENGDMRKPLFKDTSKLVALDFGCGEGRVVRRMLKHFNWVHGCDISEKMLSEATPKTGVNWYLTDGIGCGDAPDNTFNFIYTTISMQHICPFDIRHSIIMDIKEKLKPGGKFTFQLLYNADDNLKHHSCWYDNNFQANTTNSGCDVLIRPSSLPLVRDYFSEHFKDVKVWFHDISRYELRNQLHPNHHMGPGYHGTHFIFISGEK